MMTGPSGFEFNLLRALEVFHAVVEARQVTAAARMLGVTQSAASQQVRTLERAFGTVLIDRAAQPLELTEAGQALYRRSTRILSEVEDLKSEINRLGTGPIPILRIGMLASIATTLTPPLTQLANRLQIPEVSFYAGLASDHEAMLRNRRTNLVITSDAFYDLDDLDRRIVLDEPYLLVVPSGYQGPVDDLEELGRELPFIRFAANTPVGRRTEQHLRRGRITLPRTIEADRASMVVAGVASGPGFTILTPTLLLDALAEGMSLSIHRLPRTGFRRTLSVVSRSRDLGELPVLIAELASETLAHAIKTALPNLPEPVIYPEPRSPNSHH